MKGSLDTEPGYGTRYTFTATAEIPRFIYMYIEGQHCIVDREYARVAAHGQADHEAIAATELLNRQPDQVATYFWADLEIGFTKTGPINLRGEK